MATAITPNVDDIRRQMAQIRMELHQDVQGLVAGTEAASDWKYYVRHYPWAAIGAAALVGYLVVPRRRRSVTATAHQAAEVAARKVVEEVAAATNGNGHGKAEAHPAAKKEKEKRKAGLFGLALSFAGPIVMRAAQAYVSNHLESFLVQQGMLDPNLLGGDGGGDTTPGPRPATGMAPPGTPPPPRPR